MRKFFLTNLFVFSLLINFSFNTRTQFDPELLIGFWDVEAERTVNEMIDNIKDKKEKRKSKKQKGLLLMLMRQMAVEFQKENKVKVEKADTFEGTYEIKNNTIICTYEDRKDEWLIKKTH